MIGKTMGFFIHLWETTHGKYANLEGFSKDGHNIIEIKKTILYVIIFHQFYYIL